MARKPAVLDVAPQLPPGSVNFNAFHNAIAGGASAEEAQAAGSIAPAQVAAPKGAAALKKETK